MKNVADKSVNELYGGIRNRYNDARANGYRLHTYFLREQEIILSTLDHNPGIVIDIGCGSGLMAIPLISKSKLLLGIDFNEQACKTAKKNSLTTIRGNAFSMPLDTQCINSAYCCQFLNQQSHNDMKLLLSESYRVLLPNGKLILIWRNGEALIHKVAHLLFSLLDKAAGRPSFPMVNHSLSSVEDFAKKTGFATTRKQAIFPLLRWHSDNINGFLAKIIGASFILVLKRN